MGLCSVGAGALSLEMAFRAGGGAGCPSTAQDMASSFKAASCTHCPKGWPQGKRSVPHSQDSLQKEAGLGLMLSTLVSLFWEGSGLWELCLKMGTRTPASEV